MIIQKDHLTGKKIMLFYCPWNWLLVPPPPAANIDTDFTCRTERKKIKTGKKEVAIMAVLAGGVVGGGAKFNDNKSLIK